LLDDQKVTRASDETYAASEYLTSRDAVNTLTEKGCDSTLCGL
jgi:hypothetical protein